MLIVKTSNFNMSIVCSWPSLYILKGISQNVFLKMYFSNAAGHLYSRFKQCSCLLFTFPWPPCCKVCTCRHQRLCWQNTFFLPLTIPIHYTPSRCFHQDFIAIVNSSWRTNNLCSLLLFIALVKWTEFSRLIVSSEFFKQGSTGNLRGQWN